MREMSLLCKLRSIRKNSLAPRTVTSRDSEDVQVYETTSVEEAHGMCNAGWVVRSVKKGQYQNGDAALIFCLGWKYRDKSPTEPRQASAPQMGSLDQTSDPVE
jgi:hypothetical protein